MNHNKCLPAHLACVACVVTALVLLGPARATAELQGPQIYWIDVEGGAATLIVTPAGETVLIDTGNPGPRDPGRIAKVVTEVVQARKIDHLIITHYHKDHFGGAALLARMLPIGTVYDNGVGADIVEKPDRGYREFACDSRRVMQPGMTIDLASTDGQAPLVLECLGTRKTFAESDANPENATCAIHRPKDRDGSDNANSIVMRLRYGNWVFLDAGDLTWNQEYRLVCPHDGVGLVDVYQVTHHGLDSSNNPVVLRTAQPRVAIMNNGATKGCMPEVFANLKQTPSLQAIYQLHKNQRPDGAVNNVSTEYIANREADCEGHYIHLAVAADGANYTVNIPAHGHSRTFPTRKGPSQP